MFRSSHCLHTFLPDLKVTDIVLRNSGTCFNLPHCSYKLYKQSFVNKCFFCDCCWYVLFCGTYMLFDLIWCIFFLYIIGLRLSVLINDMLCYVILCVKLDWDNTGFMLSKICRFWRNFWRIKVCCLTAQVIESVDMCRLCWQCQWFFGSWDEDVNVPFFASSSMEPASVTGVNNEMLLKAELMGVHFLFSEIVHHCSSTRVVR